VRVLVALLVSALTLIAPAAAGAAGPALAELEREVMCPTCKTPLELSDAPAADRIRAFIRARIAAGDTKDEIKAQLVREFGVAVLAAPPREGFDLLAWLLPLVGVPCAGIAIGLIAWRWRARASPPRLRTPGGRAVDGLDPAVERRLDEELARFDS
jgi:cytochrome c-type biogenesis protein CcmH